MRKKNWGVQKPGNKAQQTTGGEIWRGGDGWPQFASHGRGATQSEEKRGIDSNRLYWGGLSEKNEKGDN